MFILIYCNVYKEGSPSLRIMMSNYVVMKLPGIYRGPQKYRLKVYFWTT